MHNFHEIVKSYSVKTTLTKTRNNVVLWKNSESNILPYDYSYLIKNSTLADSVEVTNDFSIGCCERYGGSGIGLNGGGVRTINIDGIQIKGSGSCVELLGNDDITHSYGGLDAVSGIKEAIMSHVCGLVLPYGAVTVHALLWVGEDTGYFDSMATWGVLLLRDIVDRPAHFIRAPLFKPKKYSGVCRDYIRVKNQLQELHRTIGADCFIKRIIESLYNNAQQIAAASMSRMCHNSMTCSNITLSGAWIDLPLTSFTGSGVNRGQNTDFFTEYRKPLKAIKEMVYNYSKYNRVDISIQYLEDFYLDTLRTHRGIYAGWSLGISSVEAHSVCGTPSWGFISQHIENTIMSGDPHRIQNLSKLDMGDPLNNLLCSFVSMAFSNKPSTDKNKCRLFQHYHNCMVEIFPQGDVKTIIKVRLLQGLKRVWLSSFFMLHYNDGRVRSLVYNERPTAIYDLIDSCINAANWIFENNLSSEETKVTIYHTSSILIELDVACNDDRMFLLKNLFYSTCLTDKELIVYVNENIDDFFIKGWDFKFWLDLVIRCIEGNPHGS